MTDPTHDRLVALQSDIRERDDDRTFPDPAAVLLAYDREVLRHRDDPERAHGNEDELTYRVLRQIADDGDELAETMVACMESNSDMTRWYA